MNSLASKTLPSREISYHYCVAMFMAQQFEDDLRYILDSAQHYGLVDELELSKHEKKKFKDSAELLENATWGRLVIALKKRVNLPSEKHWEILDAALRDRNHLAHKLLVQFDYEDLTTREEEKIVQVIHEMFLRLWKAVQIIRALKRSLDSKTDRIDVSIDKLFQECGMEPSKTRKRTHR